jgi:hypothetical protein
MGGTPPPRPPTPGMPPPIMPIMDAKSGMPWGWAPNCPPAAPGDAWLASADVLRTTDACQLLRWSPRNFAIIISAPGKPPAPMPPAPMPPIICCICIICRIVPGLSIWRTNSGLLIICKQTRQHVAYTCSRPSRRHRARGTTESSWGSHLPKPWVSLHRRPKLRVGLDHGVLQHAVSLWVPHRIQKVAKSLFSEAASHSKHR